MNLDPIAQKLLAEVGSDFVGSVRFDVPPKGRVKVIIERMTRTETIVRVDERKLQPVASKA